MLDQLKAGAAAPRTESSMPSLMSRIGGALTFSHLAGLGRGTVKKSKAGIRAENDEPGDEEDGQDKKGKKSKKSGKGDDDKDYAEGDEPEDQDRENGDASAEDDEPGDEEDGQDKKGKKSKSKKADDSGESEDEEMEDEDDEEEMRGRSAVAAARRRERGRCAAIFNDKAAARNPQLAAQLAFNTAMTRGEAIAVLRGTPGSGASSISQQRSERNPRLGPGGREELSSSQAAQQGWDRAFARAGAKPKA